MKVTKRIPVERERKGNPSAPGARLRLLIQRLRSDARKLIVEVDLLDERSSLPISQTALLQKGDRINFYEEVKHFEIALIRAALRRTKGEQLRAARLLNLHLSTLHEKIKRYQIQPSRASHRKTENTVEEQDHKKAPTPNDLSHC